MKSIIERSNDMLIAKIEGSIPSNIKLVNYLMDSLSLGREAVYRRLRNQVPFTFGEIIKLSSNLGFSLDEIVYQDKNIQVLLELNRDALPDPQKMFIEMLNTYFELTKKLYEARDKEVNCVVNELWVTVLLKYENIFKFFYYKWLHQFHDGVPTPSFSEVELPAEVISLKNRFQYYSVQVKDAVASFIFDQDTFLNLIREIRYFYKRQLISDQELSDIRKEFHEILDVFERLAKKGISESGSRSNYYLSQLGIESNSTYVRYDDKVFIYSCLYSMVPVCITDPGLCHMQKKWFDSLRRYCTLISECNELVQEKYINKQREYLDNIENISYFDFQDS